jgi:hypothetical protein
MRRTCGPLLAAFDVHPRVAMRILRHSKIAITMQIYTDASDDITREALRKLGEQLDGQSLLHSPAARRSKRPAPRSEPVFDLVELRGHEPLAPSMRTESGPPGYQR